MGMKQEDRGQFAPAPFDPLLSRAPDAERDGYVIVVHADYEQELRRVIEADEELRDKVNVMHGEIGRVDDRINIIPMERVERFSVVTTPVIQAPGTRKGKRIAQWKTEQRGGRR